MGTTCLQVPGCSRTWVQVGRSLVPWYHGSTVRRWRRSAYMYSSAGMTISLCIIDHMKIRPLIPGSPTPKSGKVQEQ